MNLSDKINQFIEKQLKRYDVDYDWDSPKSYWHKRSGHAQATVQSKTKEGAKQQAFWRERIGLRRGFPKNMKVKNLKD